MIKTRRDLLKYFGIGTAIVPLVDGSPIVQATSRLIEAPKVELVEARMVPPHLPMGQTKITVYVAFDQHTFVIEGTSANFSSRPEAFDVTTHSSRPSAADYIHGHATTEFTFSGHFVGAPTWQEVKRG